MTPPGDSPLDVRVTPPVRPAKATAAAALLVVVGVASVPATVALVRLPSFPLVDWAIAAAVGCAANLALGVGALFGSVFLGLVTVAANGLALWLLSAADVKYWLSLPRNV